MEADLAKTADLEGLIAGLEENHVPLVVLQASMDDWARLSDAMLRLRASNVAALVVLRRGERALDDDEIRYALQQLKTWDQLLIHNFLELCGAWVPEDAAKALRTEARFEMTWFREWWTASTDARVHLYPGLPWRRFIRKVNAENFAFVVRFLELAANHEELGPHLKAFLDAKKKVLNLFPKKWKGDA